MSLGLGSLVELHGLPEVKDDSEPRNGQRGRIVELSMDGCKVETFDGLKLTVPRENLKEYEPEAPEDGGFDVAWPDDPDSTVDFAVKVTELLKKQDYCVIQLFMDKEDRSTAMKEAQILKYKCMKKEFELAYLGRQSKCKTAWLEGVADEKQELETTLDSCDLFFSNLTQLVVPLAPYALDFEPYSRTSAMVRMPLQGAKDEIIGQEEVSEEDIEDGLVDSHIEFVKRRRLCMMLFVETNGGDLTLIPKNENNDKVILETAKSRLVIFRHDMMSYTYNSFDHDDLVLQSWILLAPEQLQFNSLDGDQLSKDDVYGLICGPNTPDGNRTNVFGIGCGLPAGGHAHEEGYWSAMAFGTDGQVKVPFSRYDMDIYCRSADEWFPGSSYTFHGGFCMDDIYAFDNKLFGIDEAECYIISPASKTALERSYEALYKSGYVRATLKNKKIGIFCGHSGDDWSCSPTFTCGPHDVMKHGHQARIWSSIMGRIAFIFGLKGPQILTDTACSSALVAYGVGHTMLRNKEVDQYKYGVNNELNEALMNGVNLIPGPGNYINLSGPHMLSVMGRCFTFDHSADGFERGEGTGAFFVKNEKIKSPDSLATMIGACLNQDGRSASMTAPNGPAQQECIRGSMREAGLTANQVTCAECHGTGTALGDPIEVGALRGVMQDRVIPIMQTSAKTHVGHLEAGAGQAGVIKCIMMCAACAGSPNCHLLVLNPHLDVNGYPTIFNTELTPYGGNSGYSGVSSFGFGGANSRADVFAPANKGPNKTGEIDFEKVDYITITCPIDQGPMHYLDGRAVPLATSKKYKRGPHHANAIRDEFASYDCSSDVYTGQYILSPPDEEYDDEPSFPIHIVGSWDRFREAREMEKDEDSEGKYTFLVALGETRCERFQLHVDKDPFRAIYPVVDNASIGTRVMGPGSEGEDMYWLIDGRDEEVKAGTTYQITLQWGPVVSVRWDRVEEPAPEWVKSCKHTYYVEGTWTSWSQSALQDVSTKENPNMWETKFRIGMSGREQFRFVRDNDNKQKIYPEKHKGNLNSRICGPDEMCNDRQWLINGVSGEMVTVQLQISDAHIGMTMISPSGGTITAHSAEGSQRHSYCVSGTFNTWIPEEMTADETTPGLYRYEGTMGPMCEEYFTISIEKEPELKLFPEAPNCIPGEYVVKGPGKADDDKCWQITSLRPGASFEIIVNRNATDKRKIVDIKWLTDRVDTDSMKAVVYNYLSAGMIK